MVFPTSTLVSLLSTLQKSRKMAVQAARKRTQSEILHVNIDKEKGQRKNQGRDEENKEMSRLRRRLQDAEETIAKLKEEKEEYKAQFLRLSSNLAEIVNVNIEMHKILAAKHASVNDSKRTNGEQCCDVK